MNKTTNFQLNKPERSDPADITQLDINWDILDRELKALRQAIEITEGTLDTYKDVGLYVYSAANSNNISNTPEKVQSTMMVLPRLMADSPANRIQMVITHTNHIYIRNLAENIWESWTRLRGADEVIPVVYGGTGSTDVTGIRNTINLPETCVLIEDWNNAVKSGWFMGQNTANSPSDGWYFGFVIAHNQNYVFQEVYRFSQAHTTPIDVAKYIRSKHNGTWTDWVNVTVQQSVPADAKLNHIKNLTSDAQAQIDGKMDEKPALIELTPAKGATHGGYIDFHFGGSDKDFTTRIIEDLEGQLRIMANKIIAQGDIEGTFIKLAGNLKVAGGYGVVSADENASTLSAVHNLDKDYKRIFQVMNENYNGSIANALNLILKNESGTKNYLVYGQHNKPSGSYTGNGSNRTISTGGHGNVLMLWCPDNGYRSYVLPTGLFGVRGTTGLTDASDNGVTFSNGVLTINANATYASNESGKTYYYQVV